MVVPDVCGGGRGGPPLLGAAGGGVKMGYWWKSPPPLFKWCGSGSAERAASSPCLVRGRPSASREDMTPAVMAMPWSTMTETGRSMEATEEEWRCECLEDCEPGALPGGLCVEGWR